jgi:hypothetical protein
MSKKIIDEMIEKSLQERVVNVRFPRKDELDTNATDRINQGLKKVVPSPSKVFKNDFEKLISLDGDENDLTYDDFALGYSEKDPAFDKILKYGTADYKKGAAKVKDLYDKGIKTDSEMGRVNPEPTMNYAKSKSFAFKTLNTISADPEGSSKMGSFPEGIATATYAFLKSENTLANRFNKVNNFIDAIIKNPKDFSSARALVGNSESQFLAGILFCDYISTLVQETDSGAAAYNFEALLAMMSGGRVTGKEKTTEGKMGAVDFRTNEGVAGSSKYYASPSGIEQAVGGFKENEPVYYIIALKKGKKTSSKLHTATTGGTSDPRLIRELYIFTLVVMYLGWDEENKVHRFAIKNGSGQIFDDAIKDNTGTGKNKKIKLGKVQEGYLTDPFILKLGAKSSVFQDIVKRIATGTNGATTDETVKTLMNTLENIQNSNQKLQKYASSGELKAGEASLKSMIAAEEGIRSLGQKAFSQKLTESKRQSLDQLIAEAIRDIKKNNK